MSAGRVAPRTVAGELGTVGPHVAFERADATAAPEEIRLRAATSPAISEKGPRALTGAPQVGATQSAELAACVARIGPALASPTTVGGLEPAALQTLGPRIDAVRRMTSVLAQLLVLDQSIVATRRATRHA